MPIVLRVNSNKPYTRVKITKAKAAKMEEAGLFTRYNPDFGYIEGDYKNTNFEFKGRKYQIEYFSGCFYPFLLELNEYAKN